MAEMKRLQGYEQEALLHLYAIITMAHHLESLDKRLKLIPNGTRTLGQLKYASRKLLEDVMSTVPTEQVVVQQRNLDHLGYRVGICRVDNNPMADEGRWISNGCIVELVEVFREHCMLCNKSYDEQCKCKLRKAFGEFPVDLPEDACGCPYYALWGMEV